MARVLLVIGAGVGNGESLKLKCESVEALLCHLDNLPSCALDPSRHA
jgi:hypothetical protein